MSVIDVDQVRRAVFAVECLNCLHRYGEHIPGGCSHLGPSCDCPGFGGPGGMDALYALSDWPEKP
jgi:hypothetical protein